MKNIHSLLLLLPLALGLNGPLHAQAPSPCGTVAPADMTSRSFATWDWETPRSGPSGSLDYCRTWAIRRPNQPDISVVAPWESGTSGVLQQLNYSQDYTRAKGWELLRENLGALNPVGTPYFILYNKYTGMIRAFFYVDTSQGTFINGALVTMSHSSVNANRSTGVMALTNELLLTADSYSQRTDLSSDIVSYVAKLSGQTNWLMAEFTAAYDPNAGSSLFAGNALEFAVHGIVTSDIKLSGNLSFKTDAQEDYAFAGQKGTMVQEDPLAGTKKFLAKGKKLLGSVKPEEAEKFVNKVHDKANKLLTAPSSQRAGNENMLTVYSKVAQATQAGGGLQKTIKNVLNIAGGVSTAFGVIGSVVGFLWPSDDAAAEPKAPPFTPTISNGTIALEGSITTRYPIATVLVQVPGTQHLGSGSTQTYYDCKLGIFTIKNMPVLNKLAWDYTSGELSYYDPCYYEYQDGCHDGWGTRPAFDRLESYQVSNDLIAAYNKAAGLNLTSVEAALVAENTGEPFYAEGIYVNSNNTEYRDSRDYMQTQIQAGVLQVVDIDPDKNTHTLQTPFVSLACFKSLTITVKPGARVFVRVKAILQRADRPSDSPPVYYVQDYAVTLNTTNVVATNLRGGNEPPFTNLAAALDPTRTDVELNDYTGTSTRYTTPAVTQGLKSVTASNFDYAYGLTTTRTIDHPGSPGVSKFLAGDFIGLGAGFQVTPGTNFVALPTLVEQLTCGPLQVESTTPGSCPYNTGAYSRPMATQQQQQESPAINDFTAYPNPTTGIVNLDISGLTKGAALVQVYNAYGGLVKQLEPLRASSKQVSLNLAGLPTGIYIVNVTVNKRVISKKVVLQ
ncbi:T9SS type A sorting domain-containing protein [Hymenobacter rubripertinctus]|uniref:T9SS C-terminal target domain-containing protein n=1 Tax=Hymenobacter rubripertinctus TaxID=2029981 RepID=A0A418R367_9BACT|nr:T9SS type A sorting domain-containing protein [Hymenobacter rubripertinctus]RIY11804.1 T9SS C-terminal target domain-containing protein [Hymenobacter rubripertinctus]